MLYGVDGFLVNIAKITLQEKYSGHRERRRKRKKRGTRCRPSNKSSELKRYFQELTIMNILEYFKPPPPPPLPYQARTHTHQRGKMDRRKVRGRRGKISFE